MRLIANKFIIQALEKNNIDNRFAKMGHTLKEGQEFHISDDENGYLEEFSSLNGHIFCQIGSISYSNSPIKRTDIQIGRYCSMASGWGFIAGKHPLQLLSTSSFFYDDYYSIFPNSNTKFSNHAFTPQPINTFLEQPAKTIIENDVYICTDVLLKPGIRLHTGCVVAQRAVVTKDVPPYAIVGGMPAKVLRYRFDEQTRARLLKLEWWKYHFSSFSGIDPYLNINAYLDELEKLIEKSEIKPFKPAKICFKELVELSRFNGNVLIEKKANIGAAKRIKNQLSYKLGFAMIEHSKSISGILKMPFALKYITKKHKQEQEKFREQNIKLPALETYADYQEALKFKEHLSYKLGSALIEAYNNPWGGGLFLLPFKICSIVKKFKER